MTENNKGILFDVIKSKSAKIAVVGLGYVGLPIAIEFAKTGFEVIGIEKEHNVVNLLLGGKSHVSDVSDDDVGGVLNNGFTAYPIEDEYLRTRDVIRSRIAECDVFIICVPTPLKETGNHQPEISFIRKSSEIVNAAICQSQSRRKLIILESTTYPGCTEEIFLPILGQYYSRDEIELAYSPERTNPGGSVKFTNIPKIVGAVNEQSLNDVEALYSQIFLNGIVNVGSIRTAEFIKCAENGYRLVCISFSNKLSQLWRHDKRLDIWKTANDAQVANISLYGVISNEMLKKAPISRTELFSYLIAENNLEIDSSHLQELSIGSIADELTMEVRSFTTPEHDWDFMKAVNQAFRKLSLLYFYQISHLAERLTIDMKQILTGILSKPFGLGFCFPGPGTGGHCIPIDPLYLYWIAGQYGIELPIIFESSQIDNEMPDKIVNLLKRCLYRRKDIINGSRILLWGITYKENSADLRESKIIPLAKALLSQGGRLSYSDPYFGDRRKSLYPKDIKKSKFYIKVKTKEEPYSDELERSYYLNELGLEEAISGIKFGKFQCLIIFSHHECFSNYYLEIVSIPNLIIIDTRNIIEKILKQRFPNVFVLGRS